MGDILGLFTFLESLNKDLEEIINNLNQAIDELSAEMKEAKPA